MKTEKFLGIDPGFHITGFAILSKDKQSTSLYDCGFLRMSPTKPLHERVGIFFSFFNQKIIDHAITDLALETPFLGKNAQNFMKLGYLRGILYLLADQHNLTLHEYTPTQVKQAITGFGGASKEQVSRVLFQLFPKLPRQEKLDATDALAVTLCGLWKKDSKLLMNV